jgi:2-keto-4-pentenoate hydratase/2-oxohepta-3-ene-1,7-dioic acid hydratase in catechol pathway
MAMSYNQQTQSIDRASIMTNRREMIFNIPKTIAYLSAGTTLEAGSLIMVLI